MLEMWKAKTFEVPVLGTLLNRARNDNRNLRSDSQHIVKYSENEPFAITAASLWNRASHRFKTTNLLVVAKNEAKTLVKSLPL